MSTTAGRVFSGLTRVHLSRGMLIHKAATTVRLSSVRSLTLGSQRSARSKRPSEDNEINNEPIKFSTSKASHRTWKVDRAMGSQFERPWWKVLPISLFGTALLLWCALRDETDTDAQLDKTLFEHLPDLLPNEEEQGQKKSS
ncbi:ubiquinol-cytochrome c reductase complex assembly factor 4 isoform X2 [Mastacembelus armatus]|uniref:ubiquinol-cytochrome c reductase complex assembly factor 4 isoform X2 n=1 Tax=Mastacembelus armatus TaxID=205130 RepID=UPI000E463E59|nr:protein CCSMST1 isoform X2 [Mastacembelus armatus]